MGVARVPTGFDRVREIEVRDEGTLRLIGSRRRKVDVAAHTPFVKTGVLEGLIE